ncbi:FHA domain-containing protein [Streptomyces sp. NPDC089919]|uniref:FHA domain-containing protein n=1 Tax=Streptomyces sp. NPDC089919 TaxID=3155188 RepID=UPI0034202215
MSTPGPEDRGGRAEDPADDWDDGGWDDDWDDAVGPRTDVLTGPGAPGTAAAGPGPAGPTAPVPPARLRFLEVALTLTLAPGTVTRLGRDPGWAPCTAAALDRHRTVSARHASVTVAADGSATVTEELPGATNGTRLGHTDLVAGRAYPLADGDRLWLGARISCTVTLGRPG